MGERIPGLPSYWQNYALCLIFHLLLPLVPILSETVFAGSVRVSTLYLTASLYGLTLGSSAHSRLLFGAGVVISLLLAGAFGWAASLEMKHVTTLPGTTVPLIVILVLFVIHALERYNRHIVDRAPYWEFMTAEDK